MPSVFDRGGTPWVTDADDDDEIYFVRTTPTGAFEARTRWVDLRRTAGSSPGGMSVLTPYVRSGNLYYRIPTGVGAATLSLTDGQVTYQPLVVPVACTLTEDGVEVVTTAGAAGSVVRLGIYTDHSTTPGIPQTLIQDFGTVATTSTGNQIITGLSVQLQPFVTYWLAACAQGAPATNPIVRISTGLAAYGSTGTGSYTWFGYQGTGGLSGALPASAQVSSAPGSGGPAIHMVRLNF